MNKCEADIILNLNERKFVNQRELAQNCGYSLGKINTAINELRSQKYINEFMELTEIAYEKLENNKPHRAIILAAGMGMRMVPINMHMPKALIEVRGEVLIERIIKQLHEVGIYSIYIVVGYMKEMFEYLIDQYGVELLVNSKYIERNNIYSLNIAKEYIGNSYIVPCDIWCEDNPFRKNEMYSWYMVGKEIIDTGDIYVDRKNNIVVNKSGKYNRMIGIAYITNDLGNTVKRKLFDVSDRKDWFSCFWEDALYVNNKMLLLPRLVEGNKYIEINTYEQLREIDEQSRNIHSEIIDIVAKALDASIYDINSISILKKGMTNRSFLFKCRNERFIMRIPGEGTERLINRNEESGVYAALKEKNISDDIIYFDENTGYKLTKFIENAKVCDAYNIDDVRICMKKLKEFHSLNLKVNHEFNIYEKIDYYENLWNGKESIYKDYQVTKNNVLQLRDYIEENVHNKCLTHIDAVPDNFLIKNENVWLIDWEYSGMQDPHLDIAMFALYSMYDRKLVDQLIDIYFEFHCESKVRLKIYCYMATCGLLWSNWCEYKRNLGVEFGEYSMRQYRYAKEYYKIFMEEINVQS